MVIEDYGNKVNCGVCSQKFEEFEVGVFFLHFHINDLHQIVHISLTFTAFGWLEL